MKKVSVKAVLKTGVIAAALLSSLNSFAQKGEKFFNKADLMQFGVYYYPEQWPKEQWARDIKRIGELGFDFTHYAEFAWANMEPEEGKFDFAWLDEVVRLAGENHVKVIMCTPSAAPPVWLTKKHPDVLMVNADGRTMVHGARQQASWSSDLYRQYVDKIVTEMAKRYGHNKTIMGWQIDNEPSHYGNEYDFSQNAQKHFRLWLQAKYKSIEALNASWGNAFWSLNYNNFDQIDCPNGKELVAQPNPHAVLDFKRFTADEAAGFVLDQQATLKKYIDDNQFVTSNLMSDYTPVDPRRMAGLDIMNYTKYLVAGLSDGTGDQGFRLGNYLSIGFSNDFMRPINGVTSVMELQPGQVNWGKYNSQPMPGAVRMWIYHVFAGGNKFVCTYRFRQPLVGGEQYHNGIMKPNGIEVARSGAEYITALKEIAQLKKQYKPGPEPADYKARRTAILYNVDNRWEMDNQPQTNQWDFMKHMMKYYGVVKSFGAPVDFIGEETDFSKYPVMVAPAYQLLDPKLVARWKAYVEQGGHLILSSRTGEKDREARIWEGRFAEPIYSLLGIKELYYDQLPENRMAKVAMDGKLFNWNNWGDVLQGAAAGTKMALYNDQFYKGETAVLNRKLGKGTVTYIGADTDDGKLEKDVLRKVYKNAGIGILDLPEGVTVDCRDGFWVGMNYSSATQVLPVPANAKVLIGSKTLAPAGVVVWR
ncbi:beta-galactosidase [Mucilaginibacter mali]|uniref:beta-galactosidase n=1 Tax=Mucilaginibacter mali TaxID=2740462 RepID=UPI00191D2CEF|nr:beta-galactosidase [Mucilaginibacter mali]